MKLKSVQTRNLGLGRRDDDHVNWPRFNSELTGGSWGMNYGMWGDLWNAEFLKMNRIASGVNVNRSSATAPL